MTMKKTVVGADNKDDWWKKDAGKPVEEPVEKQFQTITFNLTNFDDEKRTFDAIASTSVQDRQGDSIVQDGWELDNFIKNPVVPWAHDYYVPPVARAVEIGVNGQGNLQFTYQAPPEGVYELADTVWNLYRNQFMFAFSVGFIPLDYDGNYAEGYTFTRCELLEISAVVVPANPQAVALAYKMGDISEKQAKTLRGKMKAATKALDEALKMSSEVQITEDADDVKTEKESSETITETKKEKKVKKTAKKGAIADELEEEAVVETKYELMDQIYDIWWAFLDVWYDEATPASDFASLIKELAGLYVKVANGEDVVPDEDDDEDDDGPSELSPVMLAMKNGVDRDKVKELIDNLAKEHEASKTKGLTNDQKEKDNSDMTESQKEVLKGLAAAVDALLKSEDNVAANVDAAVATETTPKVEDNPVEVPVTPAPEAPAVVEAKPVEPTQPVSNDKQDEESESKQGEVKSDVVTDDGADHKDEGNDSDELTDEQQEEFVRAFNEELEKVKNEKESGK